jgi:hypothetical protein
MRISQLFKWKPIEWRLCLVLKTLSDADLSMRDTVVIGQSGAGATGFIFSAQILSQWLPDGRFRSLTQSLGHEATPCPRERLQVPRRGDRGNSRQTNLV